MDIDTRARPTEIPCYRQHCRWCGACVGTPHCSPPSDCYRLAALYGPRYVTRPEDGSLTPEQAVDVLRRAHGR